MNNANAQPSKSLPDCPKSPNCVSSQAQPTDTEHYTPPFKLKASCELAWTGLQQALLQQSRTIITDQTDQTMHAEVTSLVFRFVDDMDIILDQANKLIHIRSASRTGYSDFGVNRKRVEALRMALQKQNIIE